MSNIESLVLQSPWPWKMSEIAPLIEDMGFSGLVMSDSQNMRGEVIVAMTAAVMSTSTLRVGTGVTNPYTRHPAVLAAAFASLQQLSGGRMTLQIGRGDSALAYLGLAPAPPAKLNVVLDALQKYLRGEEVPFELLPDATVPSMDTLAIGETPAASRLKWLRDDVPKVPVGVAASGPKVISGAAVRADQINFGIGADPTRLAWGIGVARQARIDAGLDPDGIEFGAWVNVVVNEDRDAARRIGGGRLSGAIRFGNLHGKANGPASEADRKVMEAVPRSYSMSRHTEAGTAADAAVTDDFAHKFGIFGPASYCADRLHELAELGLNRFVLIPPGDDADPDGSELRAIGQMVQKYL